MTTVDPQDRAYRSQLRKVVFSSFLGSTLEYYDFLLYGTMAALVFNKVFFSELDPVAGTVASLGTFAVGYFARPVGGILFGHFGDRIGRKRMLYWTITLMAGSSVLIGLLPTSNQVGVLAPLLLVILRLVQGIALGGEWGGSVLMSAEHARRNRGLWASFTPAGAPMGSLLATVAVTITVSVTTQEQLLAWAWRVPFLFSAVLLGIALIVRFQVRESPVFTFIAKQGARSSRAPIVEVLVNHRRVVLLGLGIMVGNFVASSLLTVFFVSYGSGSGVDRQLLLTALSISALATLILTPVFGLISDRIGRRPTMIAGVVLFGVFGFLLFPAMSSGSASVLIVTLILGQAVAYGAWSGPYASLLAEMFPTDVRYTGASFVFQIAGAIGGIAPVLFTVMVAGSNGSTFGVSLVIAGVSALALVCLLIVRETNRSSLGQRIDEESSIDLPDQTLAGTRE